MVSQDIEEPDCYKIRQYSSNVASVRLKVVSGAARILVNKCADEPKEWMFLGHSIYAITNFFIE